MGANSPQGRTQLLCSEQSEEWAQPTRRARKCSKYTTNMVHRSEILRQQHPLPLQSDLLAQTWSYSAQ
ncbi:hypothetical protein [Nostoc flagelliforme]|uniref:hypothetical protein n=1 Tax=Nostoc flagelliforme TaxID=1306274 RepID=UPI00168407C7|nr:hypothetical protein [Nostoc flagelliforme]